MSLSRESLQFRQDTHPILPVAQERATGVPWDVAKRPLL
jgi:hypothetical protein